MKGNRLVLVSNGAFPQKLDRRFLFVFCILEHLPIFFLLSLCHSLFSMLLLLFQDLVDFVLRKVLDQIENVNASDAVVIVVVVELKCFAYLSESSGLLSRGHLENYFVKAEQFDAPRIFLVRRLTCRRQKQAIEAYSNFLTIDAKYGLECSKD